MVKVIVDFACLLSAALLAGALFGVWLSLNPAGLTAATYITQQQQGIRRLHPAMPRLGGLTIILTLAAAGLALRASEHPHFLLLVVAAVCFASAGLITRLLNQPINALVVTWSADAPPANWMTLRDNWWRSHQLRTFMGILGLCASIAAALPQ
jgi:UDP-N-acetylmuramyl pentapeptide phosphotransferase/UDP-N-acetylglucosamine-1-phosphate transferase